jgi:hypothetical protein
MCSDRRVAPQDHRSGASPGKRCCRQGFRPIVLIGRSMRSQGIGFPSVPSAAIYQAAQILKENRQPVHFIDDNQLVAVFGEIQLRFAQLGPVGIGLQIKIDRRVLLSCCERERRFANLARSIRATAGLLSISSLSSTGWASYDTAKPGTLRMLPPNARLNDRRTNYRAMAPMMFDEKKCRASMQLLKKLVSCRRQ